MLHLTIACDIEGCDRTAPVDRFDGEPVCVDPTQIVPNDEWVNLPGGWAFVTDEDEYRWVARCPAHQPPTPGGYGPTAVDVARAAAASMGEAPSC